MIAYILRRLILVIPTLFGIMVINFALTQFVPGGPFDQIEARLENEVDQLGAGADDSGQQAKPGEQGGSGYVGARGLPPEFRAQLEVEFGFARFVCAEGFTGTPSLDAPECRKEMIPAAERFMIMMSKFVRFELGCFGASPLSAAGKRERPGP